MGYLSNLENNLIHKVRKIGTDLSFKSFNYEKPELKSANDPVTELDRDTEKKLISVVGNLGESFVFIGEEFGASEARGDVRYRAHGDPIDGTKSFTFQDFDSSIGLGVEDLKNPGKCVIGIVYDFINDLMYVGSKNNGLTRYYKGKEVPHIDRSSLPKKPRILLEGSHKELAPLYDFLKSEGCSPYYNSGSFLLSMAKVGFETYDGFISFPSERTVGKSWDVAAGAAILDQRELVDSNGFTFRTFDKNDEYNINHRETGFIALNSELNKLVGKYL